MAIRDFLRYLTMFNVGDLAVICSNPTREKYCMPDAPAVNLVGSIVRIKKIGKLSDEHYYHLEMVELEARKPELYDSEQMEMHWRDVHLAPFDDGPELDTSSLFEGE